MFVFMDDVAFPRTSSGTPVNRVRIAIQARAHWIGCPIERFSDVLPIRDVQISTSIRWRQKILRTLEINYGRSLGFERTIMDATWKDVIVMAIVHPGARE